MGFTAVAQETARLLRQASRLNATLAWSEESLMAEASRVAGSTAPLAGMPIALKDNLVTVDFPTTCASRILAGYRSPYDATAVARLRAAGALIAAKTNMDEFAMGSSSEHSAFGPVLNPVDLGRVPGGSSGGSAALVADGVVPAALGSETGGSVRQPAAFCGIVGVKPSYGRVSRYGLVAFGSSLDCVAVFGRSVSIATQVLATISGHDPRDATSGPAGPIEPVPPPPDLRGITFGLPREYYPADLHPGIKSGLDRTIALVRSLGGEVREVSLPHTRFAVPAYYVVAPAEAAANLARYDGVRFGVRHGDQTAAVAGLYRATRGRGFGPEVRRRILIGTYVLSAGYYQAYYGRAQAARARISEDFTAAFASGVDFLLTPTTPTPPFKVGEKIADPLAMYLADTFVCAVSLAGLPAVSLPVGRSEGLPVGAQLIAPFGADAGLLSVAAAVEAHQHPTTEVR